MPPLLSETQAPNVVVRGIGLPFNSGNPKVQVNSVAASQDFSGADVSVLLLPIEIVDRIEVIADSAVYLAAFRVNGSGNPITIDALR